MNDSIKYRYSLISDEEYDLFTEGLGGLTLTGIPAQIDRNWISLNTAKTPELFDPNVWELDINNEEFTNCSRYGRISLRFKRVNPSGDYIKNISVFKCLLKRENLTAKNQQIREYLEEEFNEIIN